MHPCRGFSKRENIILHSHSQVDVGKGACAVCLLCAMRSVAFAVGEFSLLRQCSFILSLGHFGFLNTFTFRILNFK